MSDKAARLLLRPAEVAESLGIGRSKVYELISSGQLPSIRIGGSLRVPTTNSLTGSSRAQPVALGVDDETQETRATAARPHPLRAKGRATRRMLPPRLSSMERRSSVRSRHLRLALFGARCRQSWCERLRVLSSAAGAAGVSRKRDRADGTHVLPAGRC